MLFNDLIIYFIPNKYEKSSLDCHQQTIRSVERGGRGIVWSRINAVLGDRPIVDTYFYWR